MAEAVDLCAESAHNSTDTLVLDMSGLRSSTVASRNSLVARLMDAAESEVFTVGQPQRVEDDHTRLFYGELRSSENAGRDHGILPTSDHRNSPGR